MKRRNARKIKEKKHHFLTQVEFWVNFHFIALPSRLCVYTSIDRSILLSLSLSRFEGLFSLSPLISDLCNPWPLRFTAGKPFSCLWWRKRVGGRSKKTMTVVVAGCWLLMALFTYSAQLRRPLLTTIAAGNAELRASELLPLLVVMKNLNMKGIPGLLLL